MEFSAQDYKLVWEPVKTNQNSLMQDTEGRKEGDFLFVSMQEVNSML